MLLLGALKFVVRLNRTMDGMKRSMPPMIIRTIILSVAIFALNATGCYAGSIVWRDWSPFVLCRSTVLTKYPPQSPIWHHARTPLRNDLG
jgi:hypothetical protein